METKAEDSIHFLRLKLSNGVPENSNNINSRINKSMDNLNDYSRTSNNQLFDGVSARRKMFNEMTTSNISLRPQNNNYNPNLAQTNTNYNVPFTGTIESSLSPVQNPAMGTAAFNETIVSSNVEDLIDVMAKRRLAIKTLEDEMNRQHYKGSSLVKSVGPSMIDVNTRPPVDIYNPYYDRNNRNTPGYDPQASFMSKTSVRNMNDPYYMSAKPSSNVISNLEYPSETNREIYSTYLVDSIKPNFSSRRLVSGKPYPLSPTKPLPNMNSQLSQPYVPNYNQVNPQPLIPNYNQANTQPILENYHQPTQQPVQPIVNNYGPVYNQPVGRNPTTDSDLLQTNRQKENLPVQSVLKKPSTQSLLNQKTPISSHRESDPINDPFVEDKGKKNPEIDDPQLFNLLDNSPSGSKAKFYLTENFQNESDPKLSNRNLQKSRLDSVNRNEDEFNPKETVRKDSLMIDLKSPNLENENNPNSMRKLNETYRIKSRIEKKFPKLYDRQKLFWASATIVRFIMRIKIKSKQTSKIIDRTGSASIFRIRLLEIMTAIHRVYLEPEGPIYTAIMTFVKNENDMNALFEPENPIYEQCINVLCQNVEEIVQRITEFMPKEGIIGTTAKSALLSLISEGNKFPENYFWDEEKERLKFDENGKIRNINRGRAILILMSAMISRGLITTLLIKPIKFRLLRGEIPPFMKINLKMLASVMCFIVRKVNNNSDLPLNFPWEWQSSLYNDLKMKPIYKNPDVILAIDKCKKLFTAWANEYINRLDETAGLTR